MTIAAVTGHQTHYSSVSLNANCSVSYLTVAESNELMNAAATKE